MEWGDNINFTSLDHSQVVEEPAWEWGWVLHCRSHNMLPGSSPHWVPPCSGPVSQTTHCSWWHTDSAHPARWRWHALVAPETVEQSGLIQCHPPMTPINHLTWCCPKRAAMRESTWVRTSSTCITDTGVGLKVTGQVPCMRSNVQGHNNYADLLVFITPPSST